MCAQYTNVNQNACKKAGEATSVSIGAKQSEDATVAYFTDKGKYYAGDKAWVVGGVVGGLAVKGVRDKSLTYKINTKRANILHIDYIKPQADYKPGNTGGSIGIGWSW